MLKRPLSFVAGSFISALYGNRRRVGFGVALPSVMPNFMRWLSARGACELAAWRVIWGHNLLSTRMLAWAAVRHGESAAVLYRGTPGTDAHCVGTTCLGLARWCAVRTRDRDDLALMQDEANFVEDERAAALLQKRLAYFR
jgi:hypothetical protein